VASLLALSGAVLWGAGDFLGGLAARRLALLTVLVVSQGIGLAGLALWLVLSGDAFPGVVELLPAAGAGIAGLVGLAALYRGMAVGSMGIVAPISAASPVVPLAFDAAQGVVPALLQWVGVAFVLVGIVILSNEPSSVGGSRVAAGVGLALLAALAFGAFFVGIDAGADESVPWAVAAVRSTSVAFALAAMAVSRASLHAPRRLLLLLLAIGVFDTAANVAFAQASTEGAIGIVAVLGALYPVVTVVLARLVLREQLSVARRAGGVVALGGAALVAAG
jgi:drug/metabolite transporter (DMT)-like permease